MLAYYTEHMQIVLPYDEPYSFCVQPKTWQIPEVGKWGQCSRIKYELRESCKPLTNQVFIIARLEESLSLFMGSTAAYSPQLERQPSLLLLLMSLNKQ